MNNVDILLKALNLNEETLTEKVIDNLSERLYRNVLEIKYVENEYGDIYITDESIIERVRNSIEVKVNRIIEKTVENVSFNYCKTITETLIKEKISNFMIDGKIEIDDFIKENAKSFLEESVDASGRKVSSRGYSSRLNFAVRKILGDSFKKEINSIFGDFIASTINEINNGLSGKVSQVKDRIIKDAKQTYI